MPAAAERDSDRLLLRLRRSVSLSLDESSDELGDRRRDDRFDDDSCRRDDDDFLAPDERWFVDRRFDPRLSSSLSDVSSDEPARRLRDDDDFLCRDDDFFLLPLQRRVSGSQSGCQSKVVKRWPVRRGGDTLVSGTLRRRWPDREVHLVAPLAPSGRGESVSVPSATFDMSGERGRARITVIVYSLGQVVTSAAAHHRSAKAAPARPVRWRRHLALPAATLIVSALLTVGWPPPTVVAVSRAGGTTVTASTAEPAPRRATVATSGRTVAPTSTAVRSLLLLLVATVRRRRPALAPVRCRRAVVLTPVVRRLIPTASSAAVELPPVGVALASAVVTTVVAPSVMTTIVFLSSTVVAVVSPRQVVFAASVVAVTVTLTPQPVAKVVLARELLRRGRRTSCEIVGRWDEGLTAWVNRHRCRLPGR